MKKLKWLVVAVAVVLLTVGCASFAAPDSMGGKNFYSDLVATGAKRGEATSRVYLAVFGPETFPAVERVAKENEITMIATVEHYMKPGILGLWVDYTTIVTGR